MKLRCPRHGILDDPYSQATQDPTDPEAPILCRACYTPLQVIDLGSSPVHLAEQLRVIRQTISLINTDIDRPSAMKDEPDLIWACARLKEFADQLDPPKEAQ